MEINNTDTIFVYVIYDDSLEDAYINDNIDEFKEYLNDNVYVDYKVIDFINEDMAMCYLEGIFSGCDERAPCGKIALKSWIDTDIPYIDLFKNI